MTSMTSAAAVNSFGLAAKGSQRLLQIAVNFAPEALNTPIREALGLPPGSSVDWMSPLKEDRYREYQDEEFVTRLGISLGKRPLSRFWPSGGPKWDGLGVAGREFLFLEAKAHIAELVSPATRASGNSRTLIAKSLREVQAALAPKSTLDWSGIFYQYTNRLAHLHFLRTVNGVRAHLVNVYFVNAPELRDPVRTAHEWHGALQLLKCYLGIRRHALSRYVHDVFVDAAELPAP